MEVVSFVEMFGGADQIFPAFVGKVTTSILDDADQGQCDDKEE